MRTPSTVSLVIALVIVYSATAAEYHVSPRGSDTNPGTASEPYATLQASVDKLQAGDTLWVHDGVYRESVSFPRSGRPDAPITVKAAVGERAVVSGCDPVEGWVKHNDNMWKAPMPWTLGSGRNQVFSDEEVLIEARFPNTPAPGLEMYVADLSPLWPTFGEFSIPHETRADQPGRIVSPLLRGQPDDYWKGALYYGVHFEGWCAQTGVIEHSRSGEISVADRTQGWWFGSAYGGNYPQQFEEGRGMIVGHMHALDQPGEWHWQDDTLYLIPGGHAAPAKIQAKRRQVAFDLSDREYIRVEGLHIQAASARLADSHHCTFDSCHFSYLSHYVRQYGIGQVERGRDTIRSGETGIFVGGHDNRFLNCSMRYSAGTGLHLRGYHHTIHNCLIDEVSYTGHYLNAITDAVSDYGDYEGMLVGGHVITFNTMRNAGRHFFNIHGNGTSKTSRDRDPMDYAATLFAHNHLYNGMLQTRDAGFVSGYYCSGGTLRGQHSQFVYNVLHDCYDIFGMRINKLGLVYLDAGTCDVDLHHNLLWAAPGSHQRGMWFNTCCVDIEEHNNVFHSEFPRDSSSLLPEDFPAGQPFRFGHDFEHPPAVPEWPQVVRQELAAEQCEAHSAGVHVTSEGTSGIADGDWIAWHDVDLDAGWKTAVLRLASDRQGMNSDKSARRSPRHQKTTDPLVLEAEYNDGVQDSVRRQWTFLYNLQDRSWVRFNQVPLGEGYQRFRVIYGKDNDAPWCAQVRLDAPDGPVVGETQLERSDRYRGNHVQIYGEAVAELSAKATGTHDVYLVFRSEEATPSVNFEYLRFEQYRSELPLQAEEVRLELRVGSQHGRKVGTFFPRSTGGTECYREFVAPLEAAEGKQALFLVVHSADPDAPVGVIDGLSLEKGATPLDQSGWGIPPRQDDAGQWVFPTPTHRPRSRPNDTYVKQHADARTAGPLLPATRLQHPPTIDGQLDEWPVATRHVELREDMDGAPSRLPASRVWIGYDPSALYVAARHPVSDGMSTPPTSLHLWGQVPGMELALQSAAASDASMLHLRGFPDGHFESAGTKDATPAEQLVLDSAVSYRTSADEEGWSCEWRIPYDVLGATPEAAPRWRCNLAVRGTEDSWLFWCGTGGSIRHLALGGTLVFPQEFAEQLELPRDGLSVWLDASDQNTVELDDTGGVSLWRDKSGHERHARQDRAEHRPRYELTALEGRPGLCFHESRATRLDLPDLAEGKISATIFAVFSNPAAGDPRNHDPRIFTASDGQAYDYQIGLCLTVPGMQTGGPRQSMATLTDRWAKSVRVGCFSPHYQTFFTGVIAEIVVYDRTLTAGEIDLVRTYLLCRWGL